MICDAKKLLAGVTYLQQAAQRWPLVELVALSNKVRRAGLDYLANSLCLAGFAVYFFFPLSAGPFSFFCLGFLTLFLPLVPISGSS